MPSHVLRNVQTTVNVVIPVVLHVEFESIARTSMDGRISKAAEAMFGRNRLILPTNCGGVIGHARYSSSLGVGNGISRSLQSAIKRWEVIKTA
jgi:hypothetical protein